MSSSYQDNSERYNKYNVASAKTGRIELGDRIQSSPRSRTNALAGMHVSKEVADEILNNFMNTDDNSAKTWSRIVVEKYLVNVRFRSERGIRSLLSFSNYSPTK